MKFALLGTLTTFILLACQLGAAAADYWVPSSDSAVVTNNDCGVISDVAGSPVIRRPFQSESDPGVAVHVADRITSGDELVVPDGSRLEWISGSNMVLVLGSGGRAKLGGLRTFTAPDGAPVTRLDVTLLSGELRVQVRLNRNRPEAVLAALSGAEVLIRRGDIGLYSGNFWRGVALSGEAFARMRRGGVSGAPFAFVAGSVVGSAGEERMDESDMNDLKRRTPFSFELVGAALPPIPPMSAILEAP